MALDEKTLAQLKEQLLAEKKRLEEELGRIGTPTGGEGTYETKFESIGDDEDENATEVEGYADNLAVEETLEAELKDVSDALGKMEAGKYGICEKTGKEIPLERLMAYPAARTIIEA
ncbi:MAG: TraR/DksA C4-type zinc finger protein [Candidatus Moraniibacteriota bacterium]